MNHISTHKLQRVVGFAVLVENEDGTRMIIYSNDIDQGNMKITVPDPLMVEGADRVMLALPQQHSYDLHLSGEHFNIQMDVEPLQDILEQKEPKLLAADD